MTHAQTKIKAHYDENKTNCNRSVQPGEKVLVLLSMVGSSLQAKFAGPCLVETKTSDNNYVIQTTHRQRKSGVCHMLKSLLKKPLGCVSPRVHHSCHDDDENV